MRRAAVKVLSVLVATGCALQLSGCNGGDWVVSEITLTITPASAGEGDGVLTAEGEVAISRMCDDDLTVDLASDDEAVLTVPATVTIPAGEMSASFDLTVVVDNAVINAALSVTVTVTASVLTWTSGTDSIDIVDDERTLTVSLPSNATEGDGTLAGQGSVSIPVADTGDLVVDLASDDLTELTVPPTVTITTGNTSATFDLIVEEDVDVDGTQTPAVTASAAEWTSGNESMDILDND